VISYPGDLSDAAGRVLARKGAAIVLSPKYYGSILSLILNFKSTPILA
jgi:hypothetical protein